MSEDIREQRRWYIRHPDVAKEDAEEYGVEYVNLEVREPQAKPLVVAARAVSDVEDGGWGIYYVVHPYQLFKEPRIAAVLGKTKKRMRIPDKFEVYVAVPQFVPDPCWPSCGVGVEYVVLEIRDLEEPRPYVVAARSVYGEDEKGEWGIYRIDDPAQLLILQTA